MEKRPIIEYAWRYPEKTVNFTVSEWDTVIHQGRKADLLAELYYRYAERELLGTVPEAPRRHLESARILADKHRLDVLQELRHIDAALAGISLSEKPVLLKGAAYLAQNILVSRGRIFSDIDVMVPKNRLSEVEQVLRNSGWVMPGITPYDNKYYRTWMHQIPPMFHLKRRTNIDVHHTILPLTTSEKVDPNRLFKSAEDIDGEFAAFRTLSPRDMLLHSAAHLFHEGEFDHGLRDLIDLDYLFRDLKQDPGAFNSLIERAIELDLQGSLYYAVRFTDELLGTKFPEAFRSRIEDVKPSRLRRTVMDKCITAAFVPKHPTTDTVDAAIARWVLYVRGHYLRMPLHMLIPHLIRKSFESNH